MERGTFIVFEGPDGSGKSTQIANLSQRLRKYNIPFKSYKYPDRNSLITGSVLDSYLKKKIYLSDNVAQLLFSANRFETQEEIIKLLNSGVTVLADRYVFSGIAYGDRYLEIENELIAPDFVIYLDIHPFVAANRNHFGEELYENIDKQKKVRSNYQKFEKLDFWISLDGTRGISSISDHIWDSIQLSTFKPIKYLKSVNVPGILY